MQHVSLLRPFWLPLGSGDILDFDYSLSTAWWRGMDVMTQLQRRQFRPLQVEEYPSFEKAEIEYC
jgi:hypothetical protein